MFSSTLWPNSGAEVTVFVATSMENRVTVSKPGLMPWAAVVGHASRKALERCTPRLYLSKKMLFSMLMSITNFPGSREYEFTK